MQSEFEQKVDKAKLAFLPQKHYEGPIVTIQTVDAFQEHAQALKACAFLGFDTESKPSFRKGEKHPVSLVQLATQQTVYLIQLQNPKVAALLGPLLSDPKQKKVGVAIHDDIRALQEQIDFEPQGFIEISQYTRKLGIVNTGLRNLAALILGVRISKSAQMSDWSKKDLKPNQRLYAATDAWIALQIYCKLKELGHT